LRQDKKHSFGKKWVYNVWPELPVFLSELTVPSSTSVALQEGQVLLEAGVLAFRRNHGDLEILLVSKKRSKNWGIPKGRAEPHLSFSELASKEAFEEAGVVGHVSGNSVGMFRARKQNTSGSSHQIIEVWVYLFEVTDARRKWPEMHKRQIRWVSCEVAAQQLREPLLAHLCHRLAQHYG
jgi:8-oxo-dGTP pyrophosphatase MutT (NUDIX family)